MRSGARAATRLTKALLCCLLVSVASFVAAAQEPAPAARSSLSLSEPAAPAARPPGGTFDASNAVGLGAERLIIAFIVVSFAAGLALIITARPDPPPGTERALPAPGNSAARDLAWTAVVAGACWLWLDERNRAAWIGYDPAAGLLLAQDCLKLSTCHLTSIDSGVPGFVNGAMWLHLVTTVGLFHGTTTALRRTVELSMATGIGVLFLEVRRWLRPSWALPAALFALASLVGGGELSASYLVDASAAFLPAAICCAMMVTFGLSGRPAALVLAALFASFAVNTHVAAAALLPGLVALAALAARRPLRAVILVIVVYLGATLVTSAAALEGSLQRMSPALREAGGIGLLVLVAIGAWMNRRYRRLGSTARASILAVLLLAPTAAGVVSVLAAGRPLSVRHFVPAIAPGTVALAALMTFFTGLAVRRVRLPAWIGALPACLLGGWAVACSPPPRGAQEWTFEDGRIVAHQLAARGWCWPSLFARVQGPQCTAIQYAMMPYACHDSPTGVVPDDRRQLRMWLTRARDVPSLPPGAEAIATGVDRTVIVSEMASWLDKPKAEFCVTSDQLEGGRRCRTPWPPDALPFLYSHRLSLGFPDANYAPPYTMSFTFQVHPDVGQTRQFFFADDPQSFGTAPVPPPECGWQVTHVSGLAPDRPLPANPVRLTSRDGTAGSMTIERRVGGGGCGGYAGRQIPCHLETLPSDPGWMALTRPAPDSPAPAKARP